MEGIIERSPPEEVASSEELKPAFPGHDPEAERSRMEAEESRRGKWTENTRSNAGVERNLELGMGTLGQELQKSTAMEDAIQRIKATPKSRRTPGQEYLLRNHEDPESVDTIMAEVGELRAEVEDAENKKFARQVLNYVQSKEGSSAMKEAGMNPQSKADIIKFITERSPDLSEY